ncbi:MAG: ribose 5-phosphate isomerase B [Bacteroidaceae bacterium]|nr:ribose 5-phosphate isomerase B [Bacteroidaceae bacterium]MBR5277527.1 ribose 5-phosphate isomerase B [Bacteroidaceae bacterium]MBR5891108.1 ribose 5-phosphate isomerase B [Bacteroidaceae bacterium]
MEKKIIGLASDHAGYPLKEQVKEWLAAKGYDYIDFGTNSTDSCDYPTFAHALANAIENGEFTTGIAICGTGNGINMTLNHHKGIRSALCWQPEIAALARQHNNANVLVMPGRFIETEAAKECVTTFLDTEYEGGRHQRRIDAIPV